MSPQRLAPCSRPSPTPWPEARWSPSRASGSSPPGTTRHALAATSGPATPSQSPHRECRPSRPERPFATRSRATSDARETPRRQSARRGDSAAPLESAAPRGLRERRGDVVEARARSPRVGDVHLESGGAPDGPLVQRERVAFDDHRRGGCRLVLSHDCEGEAAAAPALVRRLIPELHAMLATSATSLRPPSCPRGKPSPRLGGRRANSRKLCIDLGGRRYYLDVRGTVRWSSVTREMRYRSDCWCSGLESGARPRTAKRGS